MDIKEESLLVHERLKGKLEIKSKIELKDKKSFSLAYTPGVAEPCKRIAENPENAFKYTLKENTVAVISNGTSVLGLGDIGALAGIPVMEGKCAIFKELGGVNAFPICIDSKNVEENVNIIRRISPVFGGINLEDYKAPECFEIESRLQDLGIPVFHDDQHGTAIVVLAGLINSIKLSGKSFDSVKIVVSGAGSAGIAITKLLLRYGAKNIILLDSKGAVYSGRDDLNDIKKEMLKFTNLNNEKGSLKDVIKGKDIFIGVSRPNVLTKEMILSMNKKAIIFALANPDPEILPNFAHEAGAFIVATGRSDFPNQVNNALVFPGIFKGALKCRAKKITEKMKIAAAEALAGMISPNVEKILPEIFDKKVPEAVSQAVIKANN